MSIFQDMNRELATYPENNVQLDIVDVSFPDSALNVKEVGTFRVQITNTGLLTSRT